MNETRQCLLLRAQNGEQDAWKDLTDLYRPLILGWLRLDLRLDRCARRFIRHARPHQGPQHAAVGPTCVGSCHGERRVGLIDCAKQAWRRRMR